MTKKQYTAIHTSIGTVYIVSEQNRITHITTTPPPITAVRRDTSPLLTQSAEAVQQFLSGTQHHLRLTVKDRFLPFQQQIFSRVQQIPYGHTISSTELAAAIGKPHALRAVETVCRTNPLLIAVPCHRVILSDVSCNANTSHLSCDEALRRLEKRYR